MTGKPKQPGKLERLKTDMTGKPECLESRNNQESLYELRTREMITALKHLQNKFLASVGDAGWIRRCAIKFQIAIP
jgi:hypothetical protein